MATHKTQDRHIRHGIRDFSRKPPETVKKRRLPNVPACNPRSASGGVEQRATNELERPEFIKKELGVQMRTDSDRNSHRHEYRFVGLLVCLSALIQTCSLVGMTSLTFLALQRAMKRKDCVCVVLAEMPSFTRGPQRFLNDYFLMTTTTTLLPPPSFGTT